MIAMTRPTNRTRNWLRSRIVKVPGPIGRKLRQAIPPRQCAASTCMSNRFFIADRAQFCDEQAGNINDPAKIPAEYHAAEGTVQKPLGMTSETDPKSSVIYRGPAQESRTERVMLYNDGEHLLTRLKSQCRRLGPSVALIVEQEGHYLSLTYSDLWRRASRVAGSLVERGIRPGDRIAILSESRPEWAICLLAGWLANAIVVPLDYMLEESELLDILNDSTPSALLFSEKFQQVGKKLTRQTGSLKEQFLINGRDPTKQTETIGELEIATPLYVRQSGTNDTAIIVYTSGTMGRPKGAVTTFDALSFQLKAIHDRFHITAEDRFLSILPLNHLLELTVVLLGALNVGASVVYAHSLFPADILRMLQNDRITIIVGVPIFFRTLRNNVVGQIENQPKSVRGLFRGALWLARYIPVRQLRRLLFFPLHRHLGDTLRFCVSGGAYLEPSLVRIFGCLGIPLLQGYGLTETGPVISVNGLGMNRVGSVGKPLSGVDVRVNRTAGDDDGEILTRGPHVMAEYYNQSNLAKPAIDENGWFRTGDIGELDADGYLYVTGRRKNVIVLDSGKNVQPEEVEKVILECSVVRECCVIGRPSQHGSFERTEEVCAVVVPTDDFIALHSGDHATVQDEIETAIMKQVRVLAPFKRPVAVEMSFADLPKSPIKKIKRNNVREQYGGERHQLELE